MFFVHLKQDDLANKGLRRNSQYLPWELQFAVVYATHDLAASNPKVAVKILESWWQDITKLIPPAVTKLYVMMEEADLRHLVTAEGTRLNVILFCFRISYKTKPSYKLKIKMDSVPPCDVRVQTHIL
ncbi:hypothetical protein HF521_016844 [Silurus meridionalis]|uniref:Little elongation complex subunit 1 C-terminal domain-containing protein n=1 Tax=Silurus meridionalis TaxID=175797 RepID=A0A8T0BSH9_SILME|nr:hypothetical protein HF521_016844 [Silurus meridionalis]